MKPELVVVGAGPAGISAALRARSLDLDVLLVDGAGAPGGQLHDLHFHPGDVPGFEHGDGGALAAAYARQLGQARVPVRLGAQVESLEAAPAPPAGPVLRLAGGERLSPAALVIATGVRRRRLEVPGERELEGRGVTTAGRRDREQLAGRRVAVVGGGDAAFENALLLAAAGCDVELVGRGVPRARREFRERVALEPRIRTRRVAAILAIEGDGAVEGLRVLGLDGGAERVPVDAVLVKVGWQPNSAWCSPAVACDADGFVTVDARLATSAPGVWAAGDITRPVPPSIPVALGQGAQAAASVRASLRGE